MPQQQPSDQSEQAPFITVGLDGRGSVCWLVLSGSLEVFRQVGGRQVSVAKFSAGDWVGQVALLDGQLVHYLASGVHAPRSAALLIHYFPAPAAFDRQAHRGDQHFAEHPLWLACGVDRLGQHDFDRGHTLW